MKFEIKNRWNGSVIFALETSSMKLCVEAAVKSKTNLSDADLSDADLRDAFNGPYVESIPDIDSRILEAIQKGGNLNMSNWHICETTHCRAGWAVMLHPAGRTLESLLGTSAAATLIYHSAHPKMKTPDFHATDADAMKDIKARAEMFNPK